MAVKQQISVRAAGTNQNGTLATASMTSDAIEFKENVTWSLNVWFTGLTVTGQSPQITIEVSNDTDINSFRKLTGATNVNVPEYFDSIDSTFKYFRIVYTPKGATGGTKNFDLIQII